MKITKSVWGILCVLLLFALLLTLGISDTKVFLTLFGMFVATVVTAYWIWRDRKEAKRQAVAGTLILVAVWVVLIIFTLLPLFGG